MDPTWIQDPPMTEFMSISTYYHMQHMVDLVHYAAPLSTTYAASAVPTPTTGITEADSGDAFHFYSNGGSVASDGPEDVDEKTMVEDPTRKLLSKDAKSISLTPGPFYAGLWVNLTTPFPDLEVLKILGQFWYWDGTEQGMGFPV